MPDGYPRVLDRKPLKLASGFLVILAVTRILNLIFLWSTGFDGSPNYFYFQATVGILLAIFVFFGFKWA